LGIGGLQMGVGFSFNLISSEFSIITAILILNIGGFWGFGVLILFKFYSNFNKNEAGFN
jgi:hypothetical protein